MEPERCKCGHAPSRHTGNSCLGGADPRVCPCVRYRTPAEAAALKSAFTAMGHVRLDEKGRVTVPGRKDPLLFLVNTLWRLLWVLKDSSG